MYCLLAGYTSQVPVDSTAQKSIFHHHRKVAWLSETIFAHADILVLVMHIPDLHQTGVNIQLKLCTLIFICTGHEILSGLHTYLFALMKTMSLNFKVNFSCNT